MGLIAKRYASALLSIATDRGRAVQIGDELTVLAAACSEKDIRRYLLNPEIRTEQKKELFQRELTGRFQEELVHTVLLMLDKGRAGLLTEMAEEYRVLLSRLVKILYIRVESAQPLADDQVSQIEEKYRKQYQAAQVVSERVVDPELLGGVRVVIGDTVHDNTLRERLRALERVLAG